MSGLGNKMSQADASRIQSTQAQGGKDMGSGGFSARAQSAAAGNSAQQGGQQQGGQQQQQQQQAFSGKK